MNTNLLAEVIAVAMAFLLLGVRHLLLTAGKKREAAGDDPPGQHAYNRFAEDESEGGEALDGDRPRATVNQAPISAEQFLAELRAHAKADPTHSTKEVPRPVSEFDARRRKQAIRKLKY